MEAILIIVGALLILYFADRLIKYLTTPKCPKCGKILLTRYKLLKAPTPFENGLEEKIMYCECGYEKRITYEVPYWKIVRKEGLRGFEVVPWTKLYEEEEVDQATAESKDSEESPNTTGQGAG
ncbi:hypothetical protein DICTH_1144 [Dictyoglomus thermophilum H-6-12]|uniref:Uncharacterized protein n=1 Tax=Dictyoglomus thermophilum (strain ATCC 35947 / DSM 3960 / H-6-12) TaxID=309799 RepID=B5YEM3_DICT6|nr:hypothetical protein DICTH_1144 [Dictyoglomus thermophilum H-6-12]